MVESRFASFYPRRVSTVRDGRSVWTTPSRTSVVVLTSGPVATSPVDSLPTPGPVS